MDFFKAHWGRISIGVALVVLIGVLFVSSPPAHFPSGSIVIIPQGASAPQVAKELANANVIKYPFVFEIVLRLAGESEHIQSGAYRFKTPENLFTVIYRLVTGSYGLPSVRLTFIEGTTVKEMADQVANAFPTISAAQFTAAAQPEAGYLFPDTYFFSPLSDAVAIVTKTRANFDTKIAPLLGDVHASGHSISDIVIMASLIEKEARADVDQHMVAGILWNRLALGMPLQVDAARETYAHKGFPLAPIANPGLASLLAALNPTETAYLYYLTSGDGLMHYAKTYAVHQANVRKYLN